jgi:hypothetical protein
VFYGANPRNPTQKFPLPTGPVYLQFYIPTTAQTLGLGSQVTTGVAAQFSVPQPVVQLLPVQTPVAAQTVAVAKALTTIYRGTGSIVPFKKDSTLGSFFLLYVIVIG